MPIRRGTILYFSQISLRLLFDPLFSKNLQFWPKKAHFCKLKEFASDDFSNFWHRVSLYICPSIEGIKKIPFFHLRLNRASKNWALDFLRFFQNAGWNGERSMIWLKYKNIARLFGTCLDTKIFNFGPFLQNLQLGSQNGCHRPQFDPQIWFKVKYMY